MSQIDIILCALLIAILLFSLSRDEPRHYSRHMPEVETSFTVYINGQAY